MPVDIPAYVRVKFGEPVWHDQPYDNQLPDFFDREEEKRTALDLLLAPDIQQAVWLVGERRAGKTSLLKLLLEKCRQQPGFVALEVPWQLVGSARDFYQGLLGELDRQMHGRPAVREEEVANAQACWAAFQARKQDLGNQTIVIAIDEFDGMLQRNDERDRQEVYGLVYRLIEQPGIKIIRATCPNYTEELTPKSPISLVSKSIQIHPFTDIAFEHFVRSLAPSLSEAEVAELSRLSGNWPYYAKAVLFFLLQETSGRDLSRAQAEALKAIEPTCQHLYGHHWNRKERQALLLLARKGKLEPEEFDRLEAPQRDALRRLVQRGYLTEEGGRFRFRVGLIEAWLQSWASRESEEHALDVKSLLDRLRGGEDLWREEPGEIGVRITKEDLRRRGF